MVEERRQRSFGRVKLVLFSLVPATVLVILAETAATLSIARRARTRPDPATGGFEYTLQTGKWPWSGRTVTPLNSQGFPDREFPPASAAKNGCTHIVFAGDSYVFGDGVDRDSNFVEVVRRQTAARFGGRCIRVFNIGERGTTIDRQAGRILEMFERLKPDVVILGQYQNDLTDLAAPGGLLDARSRPFGEDGSDSIRARLPAFNVNVVRWLAYHSFAFMIRHGIVRDELNHWSVLADSTRRADAQRYQDAYRRAYGDLASKLVARRVAFGVVILPSKLDVLAKRYPEETFFVGIAEQYRVPHLRMFPVFDAKRSPYPFLMYDGHLSTQGNRLVADALFRWLFETDPPPFVALRSPMGDSSLVRQAARAPRE